jgi:non-heme chloroperoxidase
MGTTRPVQDLAGDWQGTLSAGPQQLRLMLKIQRADSTTWNATLFSIDQSPDFGAGMAANVVTVRGLELNVTVNAVRGTYQGRFSADGTSIKGTWTQGRPLPLEFQRATPETAWKDPSPHSTQFVTVDRNVQLEVLDWGGTGRPLVCLAGLGNTAHIFDKVAPALTSAYHVYGITRRGFGASSVPASGYSADRLGDDVLEVMAALELIKPVLIGHSIAGEELSSVGSRHPELVAGLIYLDAGYAYAYYDGSRADLLVDLPDMFAKLQQLQPGKGPADPRPLIQELLETAIPRFQRALQEKQLDVQVTPLALLAAQASAATSMPVQAVMGGVQKYSKIPVPILAIYAVPHDLGPLVNNDAAAREAMEVREEASVGAQAKAFEDGLPTAKVVRLPRANHYVFLSNEADVLREVNAFLAALSQ